MSYRKFITALTFLIASHSAALAAQSRDEPRVNQQMRVTTDLRAVHLGLLSSMDTIAVVLHQPVKRAGVVFEPNIASYPTASISKLEVTRGHTGVAGRTVVGGILGTLGGAFIGGAIMYYATRCNDCEESGVGIIIGVPVGGVLGLLFGSMAGYSSAPHRWESIAIPGRL